MDEIPDDMAVEEFKKQLTIIDLQNTLAKFEQVDCPLAHNFADGTYVRQMFMPKDTIVIGKRHRYETCNILLLGEVSVFMGRDKPVQKLKAPYVFNSSPYSKKLLYSHTDVIFANVHPVNTTDLEDIEADVIITEEEFMALDVGNENKEIDI